MFIPLPQDKYLPSNEWLWEQCLDLARGKRKVLRYQDKEIHGPRNGHGWRHWPAPRGVAWAVKQYNNLGGTWKDKKEEKKASTIVFAALGDTLEHVMLNLLSDFSPEKAAKIGQWFGENFRVQSPKTPRGMKDLKEKAEALRWFLAHGPSSMVDMEKLRMEIQRRWEEIRPHVDDLVNGFTDEGTVVVPKELKLGSNLYLNEAGVNEASLKKYAGRLQTIMDGLSGWHAKALTGGVTVVLASPKSFPGTAAGKYKTAEDKLLVRTTPNILKRGGGYASFEYIIVHELGHRFEYKNRLPVDFDKPNWWTTQYSRKEGESFAELFSLSHFKLHGPWDQSVVERFQALMSGHKVEDKPPLPEHLRRFL